MTGPRVELIAWTQFAVPPDVAWSTDADGGQAVAEFAGRACYQSWDKPNPATATNAGFLEHVVEVGHLSVLEHATATFYVTGLSRGAGHELARHRHLSVSQLSPRQVPADDAEFVEPAAVAADPQLHAQFVAATRASLTAYRTLLAGLEQRLGEASADGATGGAAAAARRKQARQAARSVLPAAAETRMVITGNFRAWRHVLAMRTSEHADVELRAVAVAVLRELQNLAPHVFGDFQVLTLPDGTEIAASPLVAEA